MIPTSGQIGLAVLAADDSSEVTKIYFDPAGISVAGGAGAYLGQMNGTVFSDDAIGGNATVFKRTYPGNIEIYPRPLCA